MTDEKQTVPQAVLRLESRNTNSVTDSISPFDIRCCRLHSLDIAHPWSSVCNILTIKQLTTSNITFQQQSKTEMLLSNARKLGFSAITSRWCKKIVWFNVQLAFFSHFSNHNRSGIRMTLIQLVYFYKPTGLHYSGWIVVADVFVKSYARRSHCQLRTLHIFLLIKLNYSCHKRAAYRARHAHRMHTIHGSKHEKKSRGWKRIMLIS